MAFSRYLEFFRIFRIFFENFRRDIGRFYVFSWRGLSTGFFMPVFMLAIYNNLPIKTQDRVEDAETSFKREKICAPRLVTSRRGISFTRAEHLQ